jgi:hypothetical protein
MRGQQLRRLQKLAYNEFKVTRQITTGNGETYLAAGERPPAQFVREELGYGSDQRPCSDCYKPCTLDYTLNSLREINVANIRERDRNRDADDPGDDINERVREQYGVKRPQPKQQELTPELEAARKQIEKKHRGKKKQQRRSAADDAKRVRDHLRRAGIRMAGGKFIDERPRTWVPSDPNEFGRGGILRRKKKTGEVIKTIDVRARRLIRQHRRFARIRNRLETQAPHLNAAQLDEMTKAEIASQDAEKQRRRAEREAVRAAG